MKKINYDKDCGCPGDNYANRGRMKKDMRKQLAGRSAVCAAKVYYIITAVCGFAAVCMGLRKFFINIFGIFYGMFFILSAVLPFAGILLVIIGIVRCSDRKYILSPFSLLAAGALLALSAEMILQQHGCWG